MIRELKDLPCDFEQSHRQRRFLFRFPIERALRIFASKTSRLFKYSTVFHNFNVILVGYSSISSIFLLYKRNIYHLFIFACEKLGIIFNNTK